MKISTLYTFQVLSASCKSIERAMSLKYMEIQCICQLTCVYAALRMQKFRASNSYINVGVNLINNVFSLQLTLLEVLISTQLTNHQQNHHECKCSLCKSLIQFLLTLNKSLKLRSNAIKGTCCWKLKSYSGLTTIRFQKNFQQDKKLFCALPQCSPPPLPHIGFSLASWSETHQTVEKKKKNCENKIVTCSPWRHSKTLSSGN